MTDVVDRAVADVMRRGGERITGINGTTRDGIMGIVRDTVSQGMDEGVGINEMYRNLETALGNSYLFNDVRSELIARTETALAYNGAALGTYSEFGVERVQAIDGDDDEVCAERNGQDFSIEEAANIEDHPNGTLDWVPFFETAGQQPEEIVPPVEEAQVVAAEETPVDGPLSGAADLGDATRDEQRAWMDEHYPKESLIYPSLIEGYTGGQDYAYLNSYLRGSFEPSEVEGFFATKPGPSRAVLDRRTELMDEELAHAPLPEDMTLYRSLAIDWDEETSPINALFGGAGDVGATGIDKGYISASLRGDIGKTIEGEYLLVMDVPAGTPAVGAYGVSSHPGEMEVVLGRNLKFTVYARDGDTIYVRVTR